MSSRQNDDNPRRQRRRTAEQAEWEPAATPFALAPQELRGSEAASIRSLEIRSSEISMVEQAQGAQLEVRPDEHRYAFSEQTRMDIQLKREADAGIHALEAALNPLEMSDMQERRVEARELGWKVPGLRIRRSDRS